jgi:cell division septum initiation protein DivIVA
MSLFANVGGLNDLELLGQNVLKNNTDIKQLRAELDELKQKLASYESSGLKAGDKIESQVTDTSLKPKVVKESLLYKANVNTFIRNSPSEYSAIIAKVQQGQVLKKVIFESKYKMDSWIFVGNGFVKKSLFTGVTNEN